MIPVVIAFLSLATTGILHTILGTALPSIRIFLGMGTAQTGLFVSFSWLGFTMAIFAGGVLCDIFAQDLILVFACIIVGLSSLLFGISSDVVLNCLLIGFLGAGTGVISSSSSALVMNSYPRKAGLMISIHHFFYGVGAITGPLSMGYALELGWDWQWAYRAAGLWVLLLAGVLFLHRTDIEVHEKPVIDRSFFSLIREKNLLLLALTVLLACGTYTGLSIWLVSFLREIRSFPIFQASLGLSLFSTGLALGRLLSGWFSSRVGNTKILILLLFVLSLSFPLFLATAARSPVLGICFMAGMGASGIYPVTLALAGISFPQQSGTAIGILGTSAGIGNMVVPWLMSVISQWSSLRGGFLVAHCAALAAFGLVAAHSKRLKESEGQ